jgi:hypothetical protein
MASYKLKSKAYLLKLTVFIVMLSRKAKHPALAKENPYLLWPDSSLHFVEFTLEPSEGLRMTRRYMSLQIKDLSIIMLVKRSV